MKFVAWRPLRLVGIVLAIVLVAGCSSEDEAPKLLPEQPVEQLYNEAVDLMQVGRYAEAANAYDEVERQHPYSVWATKAQIMAAFSNYQSNNYDAAIAAAERFVRLHPGHKDVAYAYYLTAISQYEQISDVYRDQGRTQKALDALQEVIRRFPTTLYAQDAQAKIALARDHLAGKEMDVGRYYLKRGHYVAAINRFRGVVEKYQQTSHTPEALHRLVESYLALGVETEAQAAAAVLGYNYPDSDWYRDSYALLTGADLKPKADQQSWVARAFKSVF